MRGEMNNDAVRDDEVVASDKPPRHWFVFFLDLVAQLYCMNSVHLSVRPSVPSIHSSILSCSVSYSLTASGCAFVCPASKLDCDNLERLVDTADDLFT